MSDPQTDIDEVARAIGNVCIWWAGIDSVVHDVALHIACFLDPGFENRRSWDILHITLAHMDIREKIGATKSLAHHVDTPASSTFYERAEQLLNYIDNELRPERNRYVHDAWEIDGTEIRRAAQAPRVFRPQSRQRAFTIWAERRYSHIEAVRALVKNLELAYFDLVDLDNHLAWLCVPPAQRSKIQQPLPAEWKSVAHCDWRAPGKP